jgi:hypothetical protein
LLFEAYATEPPATASAAVAPTATMMDLRTNAPR